MWQERPDRSKGDKSKRIPAVNNDVLGLLVKGILMGTIPSKAVSQHSISAALCVARTASFRCAPTKNVVWSLWSHFPAQVMLDMVHCHAYNVVTKKNTRSRLPRCLCAT